MTDVHGRFCWYELMTTDAAAAEAFYKKVMGWNAKDAGQPDMAYTILSVGETGIGGLMTLPESCLAEGKRPGWIGYVAVDDVDASTAQATKAGGKVHMEPQDIPNIGRFSVIADPQGAVLTLFKATHGPEAPPPPAPMGTPGHAAWRELYANDWESAFAFYAGLFGWTKGEAMDMGPMGTYQIYGRGAAEGCGEEMYGGMMNKPPAVPAPFWQYYFTAEDIDAAKGRVEAAGGQIIHGPAEVPGGMWVINVVDPQGAVFGLVGPRR